ncbi:MAG TPA: cation diffusion facilitator family transporter, partial [Kofleriaceae bacterium]|nr:cation diffusion facilitator family transporter [Kofleriaceae bacterium]
MSHDGHEHHHHAHANLRRLGFALALVIVYMIAEVVGGLLSNSLALLADAGHMLSDAGALGLSLFVVRLARKPPSKTHTFGYQRAEIIGALVNAAALLTIAGHIIYEAIGRLGDEVAVQSGTMLAVALGGLAINAISLVLLHGGRHHSVSVRGAWLHVVADTLGSIGAVGAGTLIALFGWAWADPAASIAICVLITWSAWTLVRQTIAVLMEAVSGGVDLAVVQAVFTSVIGVAQVHDLHVWS